MSNKANKICDLSIVLVNYKSLKMTSICLDFLRKAVDVSEVPVWVVDNGSKDDSSVYLKSIDWIRFIERTPPSQEAGFMAHGRALDLVLEQVNTKYLLLLHTDTFIFNPSIIAIMLGKIEANDRVAAVGCLEPVFRGRFHTALRYVTRGAKYYFRRLKISLGMSSRRPKLHYEVYLKSYCCLWNVHLAKKHGMSFSMADRIPSYEMQDQLSSLGYTFVKVPARTMFSYLDHIDKGTASAKDGVRINDRRVERYQKLLDTNRSRHTDVTIEKKV